jgi:hypothetical protein
VLQIWDRVGAAWRRGAGTWLETMSRGAGQRRGARELARDGRSMCYQSSRRVAGYCSRWRTRYRRREEQVGGATAELASETGEPLSLPTRWGSRAAAEPAAEQAHYLRRRRVGLAFRKTPGGTRVSKNTGCSQSHDSIECRGLQNRAKCKPFGGIFAFSTDNRLIIETKHPQYAHEKVSQRS